MDPQPLSEAQWAEVGTVIKFLSLALGFALIAGPMLLTAHAFIPSAVSTKTIAEKWNRFRAPLYFVGLVSTAGIFASLFMASQNIQFIFDMYPRWWQ
ncbi:MAG: hypothetical protein J4O01_03455 [Chloroflexi bacterium]|nr:hypothetical protein [Chloroflexota bacterium]MCH8114864.1 hypothetical protein [Chloroflexota bacterium]MCI0774322.1 hypothetical protein [Chloroflexota bacterium]MCI0808738.1 hypothetical protein [Chloroflexota bacterium]MCI0834513.1 hypothetical protein [Chloroflexota bacterium]